MSETHPHVAVADLTILQDEVRLKQAALAFDRIVIVGGAFMPWLRDHFPEQMSEVGTVAAGTYEYLVSTGLVEPMVGGAVVDIFEGLGEAELIERSLTSDALQPLRTKAILQLQSVSGQELRDLVYDAARSTVRTAASYYREKRAYEAVAIATEASIPSILPSGSESVAEVLLQQLPVPSDDTSWETILDFRQDPAVRRHYHLLRDWLNELSTRNVSATHMADKLRAMTEDYAHRMTVARLKHRQGPVRAVITFLAETLEGVVRVKPTKIANAFFTVRDRRIALLESEANMAGREIAYILDAQERFGEARRRFKGELQR